MATTLERVRNPKAQAKLRQVIDRFQSGDISPLVEVTRIKLPGDAPCRKWTGNNVMLAYAQSGHIDNRGFNQWKAVGRYVKGKGKQVYILFPMFYDKEKGNGESEKVLGGFGTGVVFPYTATEATDETAFRYEPRALPPLADLTERFGIDLGYGPTTHGEYGSATVDGKKITLATNDPATFFHELAHAVDSKLHGKLQGGQDPGQETRADLAACVLCELYGVGDRTGNTWHYISHYAPNDPLKAVMQAANDVEEIVSYILEEDNGKED